MVLIVQMALMYRENSEQIVEGQRRGVVRKWLVVEDWDEPAQCGPKLFSQMLSLLGVESRRGSLCWIEAAGVASRLQRFHQVNTGVAICNTRISGSVNSMQGEDSQEVSGAWRYRRLGLLPVTRSLTLTTRSEVIDHGETKEAATS